MKILYIVTKSTEGGAQTHISQLTKGMIARGHEVAVMSFPGGWLETVVQQLGARFFPNPYFKNSYNPFRFFPTKKLIMKAVEEFGPDIVSCHSGLAGFMGRMSIRNKVPTIFTAHGWSFSPGGPLHQRILTLLAEYLANPFCKKVICVSHYDKALAKKTYAAPSHKVVVVHNGVEMPNVAPTVRQSLKRIVFVGRLAPQKLPFVFLRAIAQIPTDIRSNLSAAIIGDGPYLPRIKSFITKHNLETIVSIPGAYPRSKVLEELNGTDLFVLVSKREGLPRSIIEAMSRGAPVIGSTVGGIPELITPDVGYVLPKRNQDKALKERILFLYEHPAAEQAMSAAAYERAKNNFSIEMTIENTIAVYQEVLNG